MKKSLLKLTLGIIAIASSYASIAQTYTFTSCGATGNIGPTQLMADNAYNATNLTGNVIVIGGIQYWVVPTSGSYQIEGWGGQGYGSFGGRGAYISGEFNLIAGDTLKLLVGQLAGHYKDYPATTYNHQFGGGGGTFITTPSNTPYVVAGGGGGNHGTSYSTTCDGQTTTAGAAGINASIIGAGGTGGMGGLQASSADAGGGLLGDGGGLAGGVAFINGGLGGIDEGTGGFGGGGGTSSWNNYRGGGGGGYSGGGGANNSSSCCPTAGGGGSFISGLGTNQMSTAGINIGDGQVVVTLLCAPLNLIVTPSDTVCLGTPVTINGTSIGTGTITWDNGITNNIAFSNSVAGITTYTSTSTDLNDCVSQVTINVLPALTGSVTSTICNDDSVIVNGNTYNAATPTGTEVFTNVGPNSCDSTVTISLNVLAAIDITVANTSPTLTANQNGANYQWLDCDNGNAIISGATNQAFTATAIGNYAVEITLGNCIDTSACENINAVGINENTILKEVSVFPNPINDVVNINLGNLSVPVNISLTSIDGKVVYLKNAITDNSLTINVSNFSKGIYFLKIVSNKNYATYKMIKE